MNQPSELPSRTQSPIQDSGTTIRMVFAVLLLIVSMYTLGAYALGLRNLYATSFMGTDFFFQYLYGSHHIILLGLTGILGGLGLIFKTKLGWVFGMGSSLLNLLILGVSIWSHSVLSRLEFAPNALLVITVMIYAFHFALLVYLLLPFVRRELGIKVKQWSFLTVLAGLLLLDYVISTQVLAPEF